MGWFGSMSSAPDPASRKDRQKCWDNRDSYFACLDGVGIVKPGDEGGKCAASKAAYELNCAKSWIDYFNTRRVLAEQQKGVLAQANTQASSARR
ncbi:Cytochrome c oxidase assembly factor 6 [Grifola frondosa]|uniref:Cytochrome c oxidase assembly factor 6 n=1 Tax=Grifola frondosa TaxID=5627 RepID=A0A1C7M769_GRIFR|nr:Cytochrome c oxidase assembly factor 6 [Grifola frondosa]